MRWLALATLCAACATTGTSAKPDEQAAAPVTPQPPPLPQTPYVRTSAPVPLEPIARVKPAVHVRKLKNGLKVVVVEDHHARLVKTRLFLPSGSAADVEDRAGATYFALVLLGDTFDEFDQDERPTRPNEKSARYMAMINGAALRFDVTPDGAWIGIDGYSLDTSSILKRLDAVITERRHGDFSFQARAQAVIDTVNELEITDSTALEQYLSQLAFGADHVYSRPIFGTPASIPHIGLEDIADRQNQLLTPVGTTLLVAGDVQPEETFARVQELFGDWKGEAEDRVQISPPRVSKRRAVLFLPRKPSRNSLVCLARPLTDISGPSSALSLAIEVLAQKRMSGELREKLGLTYSVTSGLIEKRAARALLICSRVRSTETHSATRIMLEELSKFATAPPTDDELETVRAMAITQAETAQDDLSGIVEAWRHAAIMRREAPDENEVAELRKVSSADLVAIAKKLAVSDTVQVIFSGERALVEAAARTNNLGPLKVPVLGRVSDD